MKSSRTFNTLFFDLCMALLLFLVTATLPEDAVAEQTTNISDADMTIIGFISINQFSDRGIAINLFRDMDIADQGDDQGLVDVIATVDKVAEHVKSQLDTQPPKRRERSQTLEWPWEQQKPLKNTQSKELQRLSVLRFCRRGLVELFQPEYQGLLDTPLEERESLMKTITPTVDQSLLIYKLLVFGNRVKRSEVLAAAGRLRELSIEFDRAIFLALNDSERERVAVLINMSAPIWLQMAVLESKSRMPPFGSLNLAGILDDDPVVEKKTNEERESKK